MTPTEFVNAFRAYAEATEKETGISAVFTLAQAALESGWGKHAPGNNFFGVKARSGWKGAVQLLSTREVHSTDQRTYPIVISITKRDDGKYEYRVKDWFRAYTTPEGSFTDHGRFFLDNPRYTEALNVKDEAEKFARAVASAGYATDPGYAATLVSIIGTITRIMSGRG